MQTVRETTQPETTGAIAKVDVASLTPAMRQYVEQKKRVGDAVLLFRMGDFYETFFDDAVLCAKVLGITLTARNKGDNPIPLAGIPYHALDGYLKKLVDAGYKVAISEQMEDPKQAKGVVKRDIVRIVTAGTLTDESLLGERDDNLLAAVWMGGKAVGLAVVELASGRLEVLDVTTDTLLDELVRQRPAELLIDDELVSQAMPIAEQLQQLCQTTVSRRPLHEFASYQAEKSLLDHFGVATLAGFGFEEVTPSLCAAGALIQYLQQTQKTELEHIVSIRSRITAEFLQIDHSSWRSLEIERTLRHGRREGTLLDAIDRTVHPIGARRLRHWLRMPLTDPSAIRSRQAAVALLVEDDVVRANIRKRLRAMADIERIAGRVALARATPRDLVGLAGALAELPALHNAVRESPADLLADIARNVTGLEALEKLLSHALREDPPMTVREGGIIADGFDEELDRLRAIGRDGKSWLAQYQRDQIEATGITSLKVGFNRVFGYYLEVPNSAREQVPPHFVRKQTIKSAERYITDELKQYETEVLTASDRANDLEYRLFDNLRAQAGAEMGRLIAAADAIGRLDVLAGLAEIAEERRYIKPELVTDDKRQPAAALLSIDEGRHPVLDQVLGDQFVPNDLRMGEGQGRVLVITGPNMAGKSTYIRQIALMALLAQTGSFVPAKQMRWSVVDRIFARVGSADEIMRGQSTFMVEMTEAANILHNATDRSLVVLDELGRGTSTFDGLSLAWAITEHLANKVHCRSLVATHYHELTELSELLTGVANYNVAVREYAPSDGHDEGIVFLHRIVPGGASKSYGVHVAKLAGIPKTVITRSQEVLDELQRGFRRETQTPQLSRNRTRIDAQLPLFTDAEDAICEELRTLDPEQITPLDALSRIAAWKEQLND